MIKVGDIVKLKKEWFDVPPMHKRQRKWRWKVEELQTASPPDAPAVALYPAVLCRRLDTKTHRRERWTVEVLTPISFWERITKRY